MAVDALLEAAAHIIIDVVLTEVFYWPGWVILRVLTLGRYPPPRGIEHNRQFVAVVAVAALFIGAAIYYSVFHK